MRVDGSDPSGLPTSPLSTVAGNANILSTALVTTTLLKPLQVFSASSQPSDLANFVEQSQGTFAFNNGLIVSTIVSPAGNLTGTVNIADLAGDLTDSLQQINGTLDFADGLVTSNLTTPIGPLQGTYAFATSAGNAINTFIDDIEGTIPFTNGQFNVDLPTSLGKIAGTVGFANGQLDSNLTTPFGPITGSIDFPDDAQFSFTSGRLEGLVDLAQGQVSFDLLPNLPGGEVAIPLSSLSGTVGLANGQATITIPTAVGDVATNFDFSQLAEDFVTESLQITGRLTFNNGILTSDLVGPLGTFAGTFNLVQAVADANTFLQQVQGTVSLTDGLLVSNLTTPAGPLQGTLNLAALADDLAPLLAIDLPSGAITQQITSANVPASLSGEFSSAFSTELGEIDFRSLVNDLVPLVSDTPFLLGPTFLQTLAADPALLAQAESVLETLDPAAVLADPFLVLEGLV